MKLTVLARMSCLVVCALVSAWAGVVLGEDQPWVVYEGKQGPGVGKHLVFVTGDDEYRSEEGMPMLGRLLAERYGFKCTVLFAIDPNDGTIKPDYQQNIPGTHFLETADLMVLFTRFRNLPDEQMKPIVDFIHSGKPMIGLRTATHPFNYPGNSTSPYARFHWRSRSPEGGFGQLVFGDTWVSHHGNHGSQSTRGVINEVHAKHPVVQGCTDIWGPTDVYGIVHLPADAQVLVWGQVLAGMNPKDEPVEAKNNPMMPLAWVRQYSGETGKNSRVFFTTMGASQDLLSPGLRRLLLNAVLWGLEMEGQIQADSNVDIVGTYEPTRFGFGTYKKGLKPADFK